MVTENPQFKKPNYESMDYNQLEADSVAGPVLQRKALEYLKTKDREYFEREFTGKLDSEGYLESKNGGSSNTKPSQNIGGGIAMEEVIKMTKAELRGINTETVQKSSSPEVSQKSVAEKKLTLDIVQATDWRSLWKAVDDNGGLQGSEKFYSTDELSSLISRVRKGDNPLLLTGAFGFRTKVLDLLKIEKLKEELK